MQLEESIIDILHSPLKHSETLILVLHTHAKLVHVVEMLGIATTPFRQQDRSEEAVRNYVTIRTRHEYRFHFLWSNEPTVHGIV